MERDPSCGLCRDSNGSTVLLETESFVTLPGVGQFSEEGGYLLIITKDHQYTSSNGFSRKLYDELEEVMRESALAVRNVYGVDPLFFEHGSTCHSKAGQCVTHMHMNLVPFELDLSKYLRPELTIELDYLHELEKVQPPYLYIRTPDGRHFAEPASNLNIPSQYLRAAIGKELNHPEPSFWNWRIRRAQDDGYADEDAIEQTIENLKSELSRLSFSRPELREAQL
jgi:diadenosine tetraphosphate (Ap4A) HIT family hydrolase